MSRNILLRLNDETEFLQEFARISDVLREPIPDWYRQYQAWFSEHSGREIAFRCEGFPEAPQTHG